MKKPYVEIREINGGDINKLTKPNHDVVRYLNDSVKTEFQTYSSIVKNSQPTEQVISSETLKSVVKRVVEE